VPPARIKTLIYLITLLMVTTLQLHWLVRRSLRDSSWKTSCQRIFSHSKLLRYGHMCLCFRSQTCVRTRPMVDYKKQESKWNCRRKQTQLVTKFYKARCKVSCIVDMGTAGRPTKSRMCFGNRESSRLGEVQGHRSWTCIRPGVEIFDRNSLSTTILFKTERSDRMTWKTHRTRSSFLRS